MWVRVSHSSCALCVANLYLPEQAGVPPFRLPPQPSTFSSKMPWEDGTGTDLLPQAQVVKTAQTRTALTVHLFFSRGEPVFVLPCCLFVRAGGGFGMGSRSATTSPTGSVHSTPTHQTKPNTLDPFADIGNLGGSLGGQSLEIFPKSLSFFFFFLPPSLYHSPFHNFPFSRRFWLFQQTHHPYWNNPFLSSHGLPVTASSIPPAWGRVAASDRSQLPLLAARCRKQRRVATPRTGPCPAAKAQPQPQLHASHVAPEPTQLQRQLLCDGGGLAECRG